jgi:alkylation response protein AidB-like acyl-CoA dehydrogenase
MRFDLTAEQYSLAASIRALFERTASADTLRKLWDSETGRDAKLWAELTNIGIPALLVPEQYDGADGDELDMVLVLVEVGRHAVPDAIVESCVLAPHLIRTCNSEEIRSVWLPRIAEGARVTVNRPGTTMAPDLHVSDAVILVDGDGDGAVLFDRGEVEAEPLASMDPSSRLFRFEPSGPGTPLVSADVVGAATRRLAAVAAVLNGVAAHLLDSSADYAKVRQQFGRTIGSFQAVKHQLAQAASFNALARRASLGAAARIAGGAADQADSATLALMCAADAEAESNRVALQVHGGIGFTWEHDLQLWLKFGKTLELAHETRRVTAARAGATALDQAAIRSV